MAFSCSRRKRMSDAANVKRSAMQRCWLSLLHEALGRVDRPQRFRGPFPKRPETQWNSATQPVRARSVRFDLANASPARQRSVKTIPHERRTDSALLLDRRGSAPIRSTKMDDGRRSGVEITESLLRKRAEHNDGRLDTLEEISLHQQVRDVEANGRLDSAAAGKSLEDCFRDGCADDTMWAESHGNQSDSRETVPQPQNPLFARKSDSTAGKSPSLGGAEVLERGPQPDRRSQRT